MSVYDDNLYDVNLFTIQDTRDDLRKVVNYFQSQPYHDRAMQAFLIETRNMPESVIKDSDAFYIDEECTVADLPDWIVNNPSLGIVNKNYIPMAGRCVFPVKSAKGNIIGFCGWDPTIKPKYLDSKNYGYKAKATTFYGMENIYDYYINDKPIFIVEGLMCCRWLISQGFCAMASLGSVLTKYQIAILKRFGNRCCIIPDNDDGQDRAGEKFLTQVMFQVPKAQRFMVKYGKDIDGCRRDYAEPLIRDLSNVMTPSYKFEILLRR